jgi:hypothetical protein
MADSASALAASHCMSEEKITPEQLKEFVERFSHQISEIDPLATAVLKAHFVVEEFPI